MSDAATVEEEDYESVENDEEGEGENEEGSSEESEVGSSLGSSADNKSNSPPLLLVTIGENESAIPPQLKWEESVYTQIAKHHETAQAPPPTTFGEQDQEHEQGHTGHGIISRPSMWPTLIRQPADGREPYYEWLQGDGITVVQVDQSVFEDVSSISSEE
ncbi:hypothetical protein L202_05770 [Cryptococcus amylolentus CBS 6039]|uniref:Uncharacterized protein n=2 Tax=Cryptococcus amylolentus TaxID=104669 RepID=A0A1E3HHD5_9TREE|nr:hypothetical protein L202_05770 [Cryptococcus amylolentus CBS 6039]ODN75758.1 hypothetical protein L202_05770 [Cryptococcus amylolentus CBS 6039]ODN96931.1 hypothetical protein I350_07906 [Cryptococcus amylolentus CBS 6273]